MAGKYAAQGSAMCTDCVAGMYKAFLMPSFDARQGPFRTRVITGVAKECSIPEPRTSIMLVTHQMQLKHACVP